MPEPCNGCGGETLLDAMRDIGVDPRASARPATAGEWLSMPRDQADRMDAVQRIWVGTPWMDGQRACRVGVDCKHLMVGILDELYGVYTKLPDTPRDAGINGTGDGMAVVRIFRKSYPSERVQDNSVQAGDIVVTRGELNACRGQENHVGMAGVKRGQIIHAGRGGVDFTSLNAMPAVLAVYRPLETWRWVC